MVKSTENTWENEVTYNLSKNVTEPKVQMEGAKLTSAGATQDAIFPSILWDSSQLTPRGLEDRAKSSSNVFS